MTKVDIQHRKNRREALAVLAKGTVLSLFAGAGFAAGRNHRNESADFVWVPAVMVVIKDGDKITQDQGQVLSTTVIARHCRDYGLKFRMYNATDDLFQEEEWVKRMHRDGVEFGHSCIVIVGKDGVGSVHSVPANIEAALKLIASRLDV